jgi:hypothetical protein
MKVPPIYAALICAALMTTPLHLSGQSASPPATNALGPVIAFATNEYDFGKVLAGTLVKHVFIVSNAGDQTLVISKVTPGCHCTTAGTWAHQIEPGKTGEIPIQFDSGSFLGNVSKSITVASNDKLKPTQTLFLKGTIWRMLEVRPQFAYITVTPDVPSNSASVVHITNQSDTPVALSGPTSANGSFKADLKTIIPGRDFELTITAVPPFAPGNTTGTITVKTSLTNMPVLNVTAIAMVQPAVSVTPAQIFLSSQMDRWTTNFVTISPTGSKALALSDPEASDTNVIVTVRETVPGRVFQLVAAFPPGFKIAPGHQVKLNVKSNNAQQPLIVVPVSQSLRQPVMSAPLAHPKPVSLNPPPPQPPGHP